jgi:hypothetical protein
MTTTTTDAPAEEAEKVAATLERIQRRITAINVAMALTAVLWTVPITLVFDSHPSHGAVLILTMFAAAASIVSVCLGLALRLQRGAILARERERQCMERVTELAAALHEDTSRQIIENRRVAVEAVAACAGLLQQISAKMDRSHWEAYAAALEDLQAGVTQGLTTKDINIGHVAGAKANGSHVVPLMRPGR